MLLVRSLVSLEFPKLSMFALLFNMEEFSFLILGTVSWNNYFIHVRFDSFGASIIMKC